MPTTYTLNNGLSKPGNGESSGAWGTVANTVFDMVDRAMSGVGAITLTGTATTITTSNGTLSEGNYRVLVLGGSPSGTNTVTIAPDDAQKVYEVFNATSVAAVFTQGSGSNVTVPPGASAIIYTDGGGGAGSVADLTSRFIRAGGTYDKLAAINGLAVTNNNFIVGDGSTWTLKTPAAALASLGVSASAAELNKLEGATPTTVELNFMAGVTSAIQAQLTAGVTATNLKAPIDNPSFTGAAAFAGAVTVPTLNLGDGWTVEADASFIRIKQGSTVVLRLSVAGALETLSDITAFDTAIT